MTSEQPVVPFVNLSHEDKKAKVLEMLNELKWINQVFSTLYETITRVSFVADEMLVYIYQSILAISADLQNERKSEAEDKIKQLSQAILDIRKQEAEDRIKEGNPDELLKKI